jgi:hypothetical protein
MSYRASSITDHIWARSGGQIVQHAFDMYRNHFVLLSFTYAALALPFKFIHGYVNLLDAERWLSQSALVARALTSFTGALLVTLVVSDIYLGYVPSLKRLSRRIGFKLLSGAAITEIMFQVCVVVSLLFFLIPGLILYAWFMFSSTVAVLEGRWGFGALKRSKMLGKHYHVRNLVVMLLPYSLLLLSQILFFFPTIFSAGRIWTWIIILVNSAVLCLLEPIIIIGTVLLYYDMRIRNEAFDLTAMPEELKAVGFR